MTTVDWKSLLNDYTQRYPLPRPSYECEEEVSGSSRRFYANATVKLSVGKGFGPTKQSAEQEAAKLCLVDLNERRLEYNIKKSGGTRLPSWNPRALYDNIQDLTEAGMTTNSLVNEIIKWFDAMRPMHLEVEKEWRESKRVPRFGEYVDAPTVSQPWEAKTWTGKEMEQPAYGSEPKIQSNAGRAIRRLMDMDKPNWTQSQLLLDEAFSVDRANALRQLRHKMEKSFNLQTMDGLMDWD